MLVVEGVEFSHRRLQERLGRGKVWWKGSTAGASAFQRSEARRKSVAVDLLHLSHRILNGIGDDPGHRVLFGPVNGVSEALDQSRRKKDGDALIARVCGARAGCGHPAGARWVKRNSWNLTRQGQGAIVRSPIRPPSPGAKEPRFLRDLLCHEYEPLCQCGGRRR